MTIPSKMKTISAALLMLTLLGLLQTVSSGVSYDGKGHFKFDMQTFKLSEERVLVNIIAHLLMEHDDYEQKVFMPVFFNKAVLIVPPDKFILSLPFTCGDLRIKIKPEKEEYKVEHMEVRFFPECEYPGEDNLRGSCDILKPDMEFPKNSHYSCDQVKKYPCIRAAACDKPAKKIGTLVITYLDLELGGDEQRILEGKFSSPAHTCDEVENHEEL